MWRCYQLFSNGKRSQGKLCITFKENLSAKIDEIDFYFHEKSSLIIKLKAHLPDPQPFAHCYGVELTMIKRHHDYVLENVSCTLQRFIDEISSIFEVSDS